MLWCTAQCLSKKLLHCTKAPSGRPVKQVRRYHRVAGRVFAFSAPPAAPLSQREARQNLAPQLVRIDHAVRGKNCQPLTEFCLQLAVARKARKELARFEDVPSTVKCKVDCHESFWIAMTGN